MKKALLQNLESKDVWNMSDEEFEGWDGMDEDDDKDVVNNDEEEQEADDAEDVVDEDIEESEFEEDEDSYEEDEDGVEEDEGEEEKDSSFDSTIQALQADGIPVQTKDELMYLVKQGMKSKTGDAGDRQLLHMLKSAKLSQEKLSLLLDAAEGNKSAMAKMFHDADIDPFDLEDTEDYKPTQREVTEAQLDFRETVDELQASDHGREVLGGIREWDEDSINMLAKSPQHLRMLEDHAQKGVFQQVMAEVKRQRMFGGLQNMPIAMAYQQVGGAMAEQGAFNQDASKQKQSATDILKNAVKPQHKPKGDKRKAVIGQRNSAKQSRTSKNVWALSDAEFEKMGKNLGITF